MFDIGGWEFLAIVILAIVVIGPKDLPATVRTVTMWARKARALAADFRGGLDDLAREVELDEVKDSLTQGLGGGGLGSTIGEIRDDIERSIDPTGEVSDAFDTSDDFRDMTAQDDDEDEYDDIVDQGDVFADADPEDGDSRIADAEADSALASDDAGADPEDGDSRIADAEADTAPASDDAGADPEDGDSRIADAEADTAPASDDAGAEAGAVAGEKPVA